MENFKTAIRPGLAVWAASLITVSLILNLSLDLWIKALCGGILAEWVGERGVRRAKELFGKAE